jgi:hypothetical protein
MKTIISTFSLILMVSCGCNKSISHIDKVANLISDCPKDGTCVLEVFKNKSITVKQDEFGSIYYSIDDNLNSKVYKYVYSRTIKGDLQDAGYREEIVFELNNDITKQSFLNNEIQSTKMLFGRFCFCRGQTGNYKVTDGNLDINENKLTLNFNISEVPQIIKNITIDLK